MSKLERTWWFALPVYALSAIFSFTVMRLAGVLPPAGWAQGLLYFFCFVGFARTLSFVGWLAGFCVRSADT